MLLAAIGSGVMVLTLIVVILIDIPYQIISHNKKLKMSKDEVKREHKESEGDPQIKARIRQQQQAMARGRMMSKVPEADVVITNPTHYAVALKYEEHGMTAPILVAKGTDRVAERLCAISDEHAIPRLEAPALARALYHYVDLEAEIPMALYTAVAEVMAWAYQLREFNQHGGEAPPTPANLPVPDTMQVQARDAGDAEARP
jgi:flagellar biosynthetic protein FlhB